MSESLERVIADKMSTLTNRLDENAQPKLGKDVDWSKYHLDQNVAHLYPIATFVTNEDGTSNWVAPIEVFDFVSAPYNPSKRHTKTLGETVTERVNGPDRWKIATVFSNQPGLGIVMFSRTVPIALPTPSPLILESEIDPLPTSQELELQQAAAEQWMKTEGIEQPEQANLINVEN